MRKPNNWKNVADELSGPWLDTARSVSKPTTARSYRCGAHVRRAGRGHRRRLGSQRRDSVDNELLVGAVARLW